MKTSKHHNPADFIPTCPDDFVGPAAEVARVFAAKAEAVIGQRHCNLKYVIPGPPGTGKTRLAEFLAAKLTGERIVKGQSFHVESVNGRNVDLTLIRRWQSESRYIPTGWVVRIVNELDTCKQDAEDLLLTYLDEMPAKVAFIGTSNLKLTDMSERFQSRLQPWTVKPPSNDDIAKLLRRLGMKSQEIANIALGCGGNVRAACLDAQSILDARLAT